MKIMKENPGHTERYIGRLAPPKLLLEMLNAFKTLITEQAPPPLLQERGPGGEVERSSGGEVKKGPGGILLIRITARKLPQPLRTHARMVTPCAMHALPRWSRMMKGWLMGWWWDISLVA